MTRYAFVVDLERCMGCRACAVACKAENNTAEGVFWMHVFRFEDGEYPNARLTFMPRPCMHCDNPPCVKVCPVGARYKREDGFVLTNFDTCIGCRYCEVACPYGVNYFNWKKPDENYYYNWKSNVTRKENEGIIPPWRNPDHENLYGPERRLTSGGGHRVGIIEKCTWCVHRVEKGLKPACVANCPASALLFGDLDDINSDVSRILREKRTFRLLEEMGTEPRVLYVGSPPGAKSKTIQGSLREYYLTTVRVSA